MFELILAVRFLKEGKFQTLLIMAGIAIGIAVLVFLNALISGLQSDLIDGTVGSSAHIVASSETREPPQRIGADDRYDQVFSRNVIVSGEERPVRNWASVTEELEELDELTAINPTATESGFVNRGETSLPIVFRSFSLERANDIYDIDERIVEGEFEAGGDQVLIGKGLAEDLRAEPGSVIRIDLPELVDGTFSVAGIFDLGSQEVNNRWVVTSLDRGQTLFGLDGGVEEIELQIEDIFAAETISNDLENTYPNLEWTSWKEENADLLSSLNSQSASSYVIQVFILLAVTMGISSVLAVSVIQKSRQVGILKALGFTTSGVSRVFIIQGGLMGFAGSIVGSALGTGLIYAFLYFVRDEAGEPLFPVGVSPTMVVFAIVIATIFGILAATLPARRAAQLNTIEVIKNG